MEVGNRDKSLSGACTAATEAPLKDRGDRGHVRRWDWACSQSTEQMLLPAQLQPAYKTRTYSRIIWAPGGLALLLQV